MLIAKLIWTGPEKFHNTEYHVASDNGNIVPIFKVDANKILLNKTYELFFFWSLVNVLIFWKQ